MITDITRRSPPLGNSGSRASPPPRVAPAERARCDETSAGLMTPGERMRLVLDASPRQLAAIDRILSGQPAEALDDGNGPLLLGMGAAAKFIGCSRATLYRMIQAHLIEKVELLPGSFRVRRADLHALARGRTPSHADCGLDAAAGCAA